MRLNVSCQLAGRWLQLPVTYGCGIARGLMEIDKRSASIRRMVAIPSVCILGAILVFLTIDLFRYRSDLKWFDRIQTEVHSGMSVSELRAYLEENGALLEIENVQEHRDKRGFWGGKYPHWFTFPYRCTSSPVAPLVIETFGSGYKTHVAICINREDAVGEVMVLQD